MNIPIDTDETFRLHEGSDYGYDANGPARREALRRWQPKTKVQYVHDADPIGIWIGFSIALMSASLVVGFTLWLWPWL